MLDVRDGSCVPWQPSRAWYSTIKAVNLAARDLSTVCPEYCDCARRPIARASLRPSLTSIVTQDRQQIALNPVNRVALHAGRSPMHSPPVKDAPEQRLRIEVLAHSRSGRDGRKSRSGCKLAEGKWKRSAAGWRWRPHNRLRFPQRRRPTARYQTRPEFAVVRADLEKAGHSTDHGSHRRHRDSLGARLCTARPDTDPARPRPSATHLALSELPGKGGAGRRDDI